MKDWAVKKRGNLMSEKTKGILCIIFSALSFAFMSLFIKLSGDIPTLQKSFFRNFVAAVVAYAMLKKNHTPLKCSKESFKYVFGRAFFGTVGIFCNFYGVDHLNIADASMLNKLSPFFAIVFSYFILKERVEHYQVRCLISAIIGAMFILKPSGDAMLSIPALIAMIGGMGAGMAYTLLRKATGMGVKVTIYCILLFCVFMYMFTAVLYIKLYTYGADTVVLSFYDRSCGNIWAVLYNGGIFTCTGKRTFGIRLFKCNLCGDTWIYNTW